MPTETTKLPSAVEELQKLDLGEIERILRSALDDDGQGQIPESSGHGDYRPSDILWQILRSDGVSDTLRGVAKEVVSDAITDFAAMSLKLESGEECPAQVERLGRALRVVQLSGAPEVKSALKKAACNVIVSDSELVTQSKIAWEILASYQACGVEENDLALWELAVEKEDFAALAFMSFVLMGREDSLDRLRDLFLSSLRDSDKIDFEFLAEYLLEKQGKEKLANQVSKWSNVVLYDSRVQEFLTLIPGLESERKDLSTYFSSRAAVAYGLEPYSRAIAIESRKEAGDRALEITKQVLNAYQAVMDSTSHQEAIDHMRRSILRSMMIGKAMNRMDDAGKHTLSVIGNVSKSYTLTRKMVDSALEPNAKT